jgi:hypothetical protein
MEELVIDQDGSVLLVLYITGFGTGKSLHVQTQGHCLISLKIECMDTRWSSFTQLFHDRNYRWFCKFLLLTSALLFMHLAHGVIN